MPVQHRPLARLEAGGIVGAVCRVVVLEGAAPVVADGAEGHVVVDVVGSRGGSTVVAWGYSCPPKISEKKSSIYIL